MACTDMPKIAHGVDRRRYGTVFYLPNQNNSK